MAVRNFNGAFLHKAGAGPGVYPGFFIGHTFLPVRCIPR